ncbi:MAG TPA: SDR family oxidoreductase [Chitinophagaceae bacterium]
MAYALITGASKGIGKAIAEELAKRKINVLLLARSEDLLKEFAKYLFETYAVQAYYFTADLSEINTPKKIFDWCNTHHFPVSILINNAGYGLSGRLEKYSLPEHIGVMHVNMIAAVELIYLFLPQLKEQPKAYIMNIASSASHQAVPGLNIYAATKTFILSFSRGLRYELKHTNVSVTAVCPGATNTDFISRANIKSTHAIELAKKFSMQPEKVAAIAVNGMFENKTEVIPGLINKLNKFLVWLLPKSLSEKGAAKVYGV